MLDQYIFHDMTFTWLDGITSNTDGGTLFGPVPRALWGRYYPFNENNQMPTVTDPILIQYQNKNYLIDAGIGLDKLNDKIKRNLGIQAEGNISASLAKLELTKEDIDVVMMTHMHNDHAGGLSHYDNGELKSSYPNATIYINEKEWDDVRNPNARTKNTYLKENWAPIQNQVKTFSDKQEIAPGITMEHTGGHSRGHSIIRFQQNGETMLHLADILLSFVHTNPLWVGAVDDYPMDSIAAKQKLMKEALENQYRFLFYHDPFYRVVEYTKDGKNLTYALECSKGSPIPMTDKQDKTPQLVKEFSAEKSIEQNLHK